MSWGKNSVMTEVRSELSGVNSYYGDFLDPGLAYISFSSYVTIIYLLLQINTLFASLKHISFHIIKQNAVALKWVMLFGLMQSFFFYYWLSGRHVKGIMELYLLQVLVIASCIIVIGSFIAKYINSYFENIEHSSFIPEAGVGKLEDTPAPALALIPQEPLNPGITLRTHQLTQIQDKINITMIEQQLFLHHGYTIRMLSDDTGIQPHILSAYINKQYGVNFNDFVNEYRIKHCIEKIKNDEWKHKTLEALCKESGFNNRNSFTLSFKKVIGLTPSDYLKALKPV
jgi:AraC-like DNA-binding protein